MKYHLLVIGCLLLTPPVRAEIAPDTEQRTQQINMDLKTDIVDQATDSKKVTKLRGKLRDAYADYTHAVRKYGSGTPQSRKAARKVMEAQTKLHSLTDLVSAPQEPEPKQAASEKKGEMKDEMNEPLPSESSRTMHEKKTDMTEPAPSISKDDEESGTADEKLYNDIVKEYGKDSPQAEALRRQLGNH